jgi:hypothetical protein
MHVLFTSELPSLGGSGYVHSLDGFISGMVSNELYWRITVHTEEFRPLALYPSNFQTFYRLREGGRWEKMGEVGRSMLDNARM